MQEIIKVLTENKRPLSVATISQRVGAGYGDTLKKLMVLQLLGKVRQVYKTTWSLK